MLVTGLHEKLEYQHFVSIIYKVRQKCTSPSLVLDRKIQQLQITKAIHSNIIQIITIS